jgi:hypothetical protein
MIFRQCLDENVFGFGNLCRVLVSHIVVFYNILEENMDHQAQVCLLPTGIKMGYLQNVVDTTEEAVGLLRSHAF